MSNFKGNCSVELSPARALLYAARYEISQPILSLGVQVRPAPVSCNLVLDALLEINDEMPIVGDWWTADDPQP